MTGHLRHDVRRRAKAVQPKTITRPGRPERTIPDESGAQQRGGFDITQVIR